MTAAVNRQLWDIELRPVSGSRIQPTGFPDIGAALFKRPVREDGEVDWKDALLVESTQSMANHLEGTAWDRVINDQVEVLEGLPYVRVVTSDGDYITSSRVEAHRLASAFVKDANLDGKGMRDVIRERLQLADDQPWSLQAVARAVLELDPLCLIHGVFFAEPAKVWPGQPKIQRALSAFVEAIDVEPVHTGGVKRDHVRHSISENVEGGTSEGYGTVPFHRTEYSAGQVIASFSLDLAQLRAYGLPDPAAGLLQTIARWEVRSLLDGGLRLRTACDLEPVTEEIVDRSGESLPTLEELSSEVKRLIGDCAEFLGPKKPIEVVWGGGKAKR
jgi:CRISPR-associated protein Csb1